MASLEPRHRQETHVEAFQSPGKIGIDRLDRHFEHRAGEYVDVLGAHSGLPPHAEHVGKRDVGMRANQHRPEPEHPGAAKSRDHLRGHGVREHHFALAEHRAQPVDPGLDFFHGRAARLVRFDDGPRRRRVRSNRVFVLTRNRLAGLEVPVLGPRYALLREAAFQAGERARRLVRGKALRKFGVKRLDFLRLPDHALHYT
ncbi:hypothetical protein D3C83_00710 [compost metagenome]